MGDTSPGQIREIKCDRPLESKVSTSLRRPYPREVLVKMNLSRAAKRFRASMPKESDPPKPVPSQKAAKVPPKPDPIPEPVQEPVVENVEPAPEPDVPPEPAGPPAAPSRKVWRIKTKRPRFVREQAEKRERTTAPALPPRSTKPTARLLTKNLALLPKDEPARTGR
jgi:hypothetical protein